MAVDMSEVVEASYTHPSSQCPGEPANSTTLPTGPSVLALKLTFHGAHIQSSQGKSGAGAKPNGVCPTYLPEGAGPTPAVQDPQASPISKKKNSRVPLPTLKSDAEKRVRPSGSNKSLEQGLNLSGS